jgi:SGNH domain (fused to AT3 domains)
LLSIAIAIFAYDNAMAWPSYWALLPVIGTCLVIAANQADASLFRNQIVQTLGKWSYSVYLWHWPIAVAAAYFYFVKTTALKIVCEILILTAILAIGAIFLLLIERIWTRLMPERGLRAAAGGAIAMVLIVAFAFRVTNDGLIGRRQDIASELETYAKAAHDWSYPDECIGTDSAGDLKPCRLGRAKDRGVLFIGDSFAMHIYDWFAKAAEFDPETSFTFLASLGCPPVTGMRIVQDRYNCDGFVDKALQFAKMHKFKRIVLASRWNAYFAPKEGWMCFETSGGCRLEREPSSYYRQLDGALCDLRSRLLELKDRGAEIIILWTTPWGRWNVPSELAKRKFMGLDTRDIEYIDRVEFENNAAPIKGRLMDLASAIGGRFVDPLEFLCDGRRCQTVDQDGVPYFIDDQHIRASMITTARFRFLDDAAGIREQLSAAPAPVNSPKF